MPVRYQDSTKKIAGYCRRLEYSPVYLSPKFFRKLICPPSCGACCPVFSLDWYISNEEEAARMPDIPIVKRNITDNGRSVPIASFIQEEGTHCHFLQKDGRCAIHGSNPLSCRIEPIKFKHVVDKTYIIKQPFGRAWNLTRVTGQKGTLCQFTMYDQVAWDSDYAVLTTLLEVGELFGYDLVAIRTLLYCMVQQKGRLVAGIIPKEKIWLVGNRNMARRQYLK